MEHKICQCEIPKNLQKAQIHEKITEYISHLAKEDCVDDEIYEKRIEICSKCEALMEGLTCKYCGCFVLVRAKKRIQSCPMPKSNNWE